MISLGIILTFAIRVVLVLLFLPFSALDKFLNFKGAVAQASEVAPSRMVAVGLIVAPAAFTSACVRSTIFGYAPCP